MISVSNLTKNYGTYRAIEDLNFFVEKGDIVGFLGPNGAGKTTTMKIMSGCMNPTAGSVQIAGLEISNFPLQVKAKIGYLPELPPLYEELKVREYLNFVARLKKLGRKEALSAVDEVVEKVNLKDFEERLIRQLSKGYRQRVGLAQALVSRPEVLILDEPTVGLDPQQVMEIRDLLIQLKEEHTVILSTHILSEVQAICKNVIILNKGHILAQGSIETLSKKLNASIKVHLKVVNFVESLKNQVEQISGVKSLDVEAKNVYKIHMDSSDETLSALSQCVVESGAGLLEMTHSRADLEQVFLSLTKEEV